MFDIKSEDGVNLHVRNWPCSFPRKGKPVIAVHGLLRTGADFSWIAEDLSNHHDVYAPDVRGRGKSDNAMVETYTVETYVNDTIEIMDKLGLHKVHWIGTSMGGLIGMVLAAKYPEKIASLTLNDIGPVLLRKGMKRIGQYVKTFPSFATFTEGESYMRQIYRPFNLTPEIVEQLAKDSLVQKDDGNFYFNYDPSLREAFRIYLEEHTDDKEYWDDFKRIKCPILVIRGETSDILSPEILAKMELDSQGPLRSYTEPRTGHAPLLHKEETKKVIINFINGLENF